MSTPFATTLQFPLNIKDFCKVIRRVDRAGGELRPRGPSATRPRAHTGAAGTRW